MKKIDPATPAGPSSEPVATEPGSALALPTVGGGVPKLPDAPTLAPVPWVGWYSRRSSRSPAIAGQLQGISEGDMFTGLGDKYERLSPQTAFLILEASGEWCLFDNQGNVVKSWSEFTEEVKNTQNVQESVNTVVIALPPDRDPFVATMSFRGARCRGAREHLAQLEMAQTAEFIKQNPVAGALPPPFRMISVFINQMRTSRRSGFSYGITSASVKPITDAQIQRIMDWWQKPESQKSFEAAVAIHKSK